MELYIIRHGQSANNALRDERERTFDPQLTEVGRQQAEQLAAFLAGSNQREPLYTPLTSRPTGEERPGFGITHLYTSAMHRAMQTAAPVAQALNLKPEIWLDIHEQGGLFLEEAGKHVGYPGKTRAEILDEFPNYVLPDTITDRGWYDITHGYEGMYSGAGRAIKVAVELRRLA